MRRNFIFVFIFQIEIFHFFASTWRGLFAWVLITFFLILLICSFFGAIHKLFRTMLKEFLKSFKNLIDSYSNCITEIYDQFTTHSLRYLAVVSSSIVVGSLEKIKMIKNTQNRMISQTCIWMAFQWSESSWENKAITGSETGSAQTVIISDFPILSLKAEK